MPEISGNIIRYSMRKARLHLSNIFDAIQRGVIVEVYNDRRVGKPVVAVIVAPAMFEAIITQSPERLINEPENIGITN